jgi:hypothetical protein
LEAVSSWSRGARKFHLLGVLAIYGTIFIFLAEKEIPSFLGVRDSCVHFPLPSFHRSLVDRESIAQYSRWSTASRSPNTVAGRPRVDRPIQSLDRLTRLGRWYSDPEEFSASQVYLI